MKVTKIHVDSDEDMSQEEFQEWSGVHDSYEFDFGYIRIRATSWAETAHKVSIDWYENDGVRQKLSNTIIGQPEFMQVAKYLKELGEYDEFRFYNGSYPLIPDTVWNNVENT